MAQSRFDPASPPSSRSSPTDRARVPWVDRLEYAVRSRGAKVVVLALVANTMVAQLLYNSAGQLVLSSAFLLGYLLFSAVCSTVACSVARCAPGSDAASGSASGSIRIDATTPLP